MRFPASSILCLCAFLLVSCEEVVSPGVINVTTSTVGANTPSSYQIEVSGGSGSQFSTLGLNETTTFGVVSMEDGGAAYTVALRMVDAVGVVGSAFPNCTVDIQSTTGNIGAREVSGVRVSRNMPVEVRFDVACT